jgi:hypothetical protein
VLECEGLGSEVGIDGKPFVMNLFCFFGGRSGSCDLRALYGLSAVEFETTECNRAWSLFPSNLSLNTILTPLKGDTLRALGF